MQTTTIGLDLAKNVFQAHGVGSNGEVMFRRKLLRSEVIEFFQGLAPCLVGMEACASAYHWARELSGLGHTVRLMPAAYVNPYAKRGKSDAIDAEAICEAVTRPTMRFVEIKSMDQQAVIMLIEPAIFWSGDERCWRTRCEDISRSSGSWPPTASGDCPTWWRLRHRRRFASYPIWPGSAWN